MIEEDSSITKPKTRRFQPMEAFLDSVAERQTENSRGFLIFAYLVYSMFILFVVFVVYPQNWLNFLPRWTAGLLNETWFVCVVSIGVILYLGIILLGKQSWKQINFEKKKLATAAVVLGLMWIFLNIAFLFWALLGKTPTFFAYDNYELGVTVLLGNFIAQMSGVGIKEEGFYRGYLLIQIYQKFKKKWPHKQKFNIAMSIIVVNILFALMHIPVRLRQGYTGWSLLSNLALLVGIGVSFTFLFLLTENLWLTIGFHALSNFSLWIFAPLGGIGVGRISLWVIMIIIVIAWTFLRQSHFWETIQSKISHSENT